MLSKQIIFNKAFGLSRIVKSKLPYQRFSLHRNSFASFSTAEPSKNILDAVSNSIAMDVTPKAAGNFITSYTSEIDTANVLNSGSPLFESQTADFFTKLSYMSPSALYEDLDKFSRDLMMYVADDIGLGLGWSIVLISASIKIAFMPIMISAQLNAVKMKLIEPEMKNFQNLNQRLQKAADWNGMKQARLQFSALREKHGISTVVPFLSMTQIPVLITWFLSLRYVTSTPDKYPGLKTDGFLWFKDLSEYDPYCLLPFISALFSYYNISLNPNMSNTGTGTIFAKYFRYFKFFPFVTIPIVVFFPSGINLYWCIAASSHLLIAIIVRSEIFRKFMGIPKYLPGSILERMHSRGQQEVIKTVITSMEKALGPKGGAAAGAAAVGSTVAGAAASATSASPTGGASAAQNSVNASAKVEPKVDGARVQVFTHKPKVAKKK